MTMATVLLIEDDRDIADLVRVNLQREQYLCEHETNGRDGLEKARKLKPDLILLDLMLPEISGLDVCRALKQDELTRDIPVIMLTAKNDSVDRIVGFEVGADDYVAKPFSPRELMLRIKALLRRAQAEPEEQTEDIVNFGALAIDSTRHRVTWKEKEIILTAIEFKLLKYLLQHRGKVATRDILLDRVWGFEQSITTRTVDTHVKRLREKLHKAGDYIETVRGIGYRFAEKP